MILKCKNKTANQLIIGDVTIAGNEKAFVFYNRKFFKNVKKISELLISNSIEFIDEYGDVLSINGSKISDDLKELVESMEKLGNSFSSDVKYTSNIEQIIGGNILSIINVMFAKANPVGYNRLTLATVLDAAHIPTLLSMGSIRAAGNAINGLTLDAFFTDERKAKLKEICDSVDLN